MEMDTDSRQEEKIAEIKWLAVLVAVLGIVVVSSFIAAMFGGPEEAGLVFFLSTLALIACLPLVDIKFKKLQDSTLGSKGQNHD